MLMFIMARMVSSTNLNEIHQLFLALCMTCLSKKYHPELEKYFQKLDNAISLRCGEDLNLDHAYLLEIDEELPNNLGDGNTYNTRSPSGTFFQNELNSCQRFGDELETKNKTDQLEENVYFLPGLPLFLVTYYMPICPLWSGLILGPSLHPNKSRITFTNAIVENWMRILKITILQNESKLRPGDFIRKLREGIVGRIKAFNFAFEPLSSKIFKRVKKEVENDDQIEEVWKKKKHRKQSYFNPGKVVFNKSDALIPKSAKISRITKSTFRSVDLSSITKKRLTEHISVGKELSELRQIENSVSIVSSEINDLGLYAPVTPSWQKAKCKELNLTYATGVLYETKQKINLFKFGSSFRLEKKEYL